MELREAARHCGRNVRVATVNGGLLEGPFAFYQSFAEDPDEPECIYLRDGGVYIELPVLDIVSIEDIDGK